MTTMFFRSGRLLVGAAILCASLFAIVPRAHAVFTVCLDDPQILLANGKVLHLTTTINAPKANVTNVNYLVTVPDGARSAGPSGNGYVVSGKAPFTTVTVVSGSGYSATVSVTTNTASSVTFSTVMRLQNQTSTPGPGVSNGGSPAVVKLP